MATSCSATPSVRHQLAGLVAWWALLLGLVGCKGAPPGPFDSVDRSTTPWTFTRTSTPSAPKRGGVRITLTSEGTLARVNLWDTPEDTSVTCPAPPELLAAVEAIARGTAKPVNWRTAKELSDDAPRIQMDLCFRPPSGTPVCDRIGVSEDVERALDAGLRACQARAR